ncbi:MAG TPA: acyl-CoA dehydrogenase, partial [Acidimicrobiales bacterium]|nr:acyl-CoA dehydrogenase [Acidimicrobiales bacterium]
MNFDLSEELVELQRIARDVAERECPASLVRGVVEADKDVGELWNTLVRLEWPGLTVDVDDGGSGATTVELAVILEQLGWAADPSPFTATTTQYLPLVRADHELARDVCGGATGAAIYDGFTLDDGLLHGAARHVRDGDRADRIAIVVGDRVAVVDRSDLDVERQPTVDRSLHLATVRADGVRPARVADGVDVDRARNVALLGLSCGIVGASQRIFELVVDHVRHRHQFGVPIGSFQAVKHMVVDVYVAIERARALCQYAAMAIAEDDDRQTIASAMAKAAAGDAQRIAAQHGVQLFGALGFTWENDLQLYVKRAKSSEILLGSGHSHRQRVARMVLADPHAARLTLDLDPSAQAFRDELEAWLDANTPDVSETTERSRSSSHIPEWARRFQRAMFDAGWLLPGNPPEFGGRNASLIEQFVHQEVLGDRRIYQSFNPQGLSIIVPSLLAFGTVEQKRKWAVPIMRAEITASLGMSEPDAGSDLAGLRTRAALDANDGDGQFVVNGQKVWTSGAHDADVIFAFVRTDPDAPKHKGISALVIPTDTPGVTRRPFGSMLDEGEPDFNEVFFDDAVVPAENLVGKLHDGWRVATESLGHERAMLWLGYVERLDDLLQYGGREIRHHDLTEDSYTLEWYAQLAIDTEALRFLGYRTLAAAAQGVETQQQSSLKLMGSEASQRTTLHVLETVGADALDPHVRSAPFEPFNLDVWTDNWFNLYLRSFSGTIAGGTS